MFFKKLSRSRSNSQSYVDNYPTPHDSKANSASYDDKYSPVDSYSQRPGSSGQAQQANTGAQLGTGKDMYASGAQNDYHTPPLSSHGERGPTSRSYSERKAAPAGNRASMSAESAPDLLTRAFNEALRPYTSKLEDMEGELVDLRAYVDELEGQRKEVYAWIDKRGLRPGRNSQQTATMTFANARQMSLLR